LSMQSNVRFARSGPIVGIQPGIPIRRQEVELGAYRPSTLDAFRVKKTNLSIFRLDRDVAEGYPSSRFNLKESRIAS